MAREGFLVYHDWEAAISPLSDAERGRLFTWALHYSSTGEEPQIGGNERFIWPVIKQRIDRDRETYEARCATNRNNRQQSSTTVNDRQEDETTDNEDERNAPTKTKTKTETKPKPNASEEAGNARVRNSYGEFGWVKLSDEEHAKLTADLGVEELERCIRYVDESAQQSGNRNRWKDWNLVIRKCSRDRWGLDRQQQRPQKSKGTASYAAQDPRKLQELIDRI